MFAFVPCRGPGYFPELSFLRPARVAPTPEQVRCRNGLRWQHALPPPHPCWIPAWLPSPQADTTPFQEEDDYDVMQDPEFLQSVLENLPGVDPNNEAIRNAMGSLASQATKDGKKDKKEEDKK